MTLIKLIKKEFALAMHPTVLMMICLSAMVLIPNYPYSVVFFYVALSLFFTCLLGRENNDIVYSLMLPIAKKDIVKARISFSVIIEFIQMLVMIPFSILSQKINLIGNQAGMDANIAFFGWGFFMYGVFNFVFFTKYYKNVNKVGVSFAITSIVMFLLVAFEVVSTYAIPFMRNVIDTKDPQFIGLKLVFLAVGFVLFVLMTISSYKISAKEFEKEDL